MHFFEYFGQITILFKEMGTKSYKTCYNNKNIFNKIFRSQDRMIKRGEVLWYSFEDCILEQFRRLFYYICG